MRLRKPWSVTTLAVVGLFALAGCGQSDQNTSDADPNFEAIEESSSPTTSYQPETDGFETDSFATDGTGVSEDGLLGTCQDYAAFDREHASGLQRVVTVVSNPDASEQEQTEAHETIQQVRSEFDSILAEAEHAEFVQNAESTLETFELLEQMSDPSTSMTEKQQIFDQSTLQSGLEAEERLVSMCNTELGY